MKYFGTKSFLYVCIIDCAMRYRSTNGMAGDVSLAEAVGSCVAPDGGLYIPARIPSLPKAFMKNIGDMSLRDIAYVVATSFFGDDISPATLKKIVDDAFAFDAPLIEVGKGMYVLELFHGPTLTVKDYGARFMSRLMKYVLSPDVRRNIIVATTGNTGAAVANSFHNMENVNVFVLYPRGRLSRMDVAQFTSLSENVKPVEVSGSIEDCKRVMYDAIADPMLSACNLTGANSINVGRLLPLAALGLHAYGRLLAADTADASRAVYSVPCGNLSNLVGTVIAREMGLPSSGIVPACNVNSVLSKLLDGSFDGVISSPVPTFSPSMDMSYPSGWPRLESVFAGCANVSRKDILSSVAVTDREVSDVVNRLQAMGYSIDTHGAVAYAAASAIDTDVPKVVFGTGHPAKQLDIITRITGRAVELPVQMTRFMAVKRQPYKIAPTLPALRKLILSFN